MLRKSNSLNKKDYIISGNEELVFKFLTKRGETTKNLRKSNKLQEPSGEKERDAESSSA